jgi:hypothetical protein
MSKDWNFTEEELAALSDEEKTAIGSEINADNGGDKVDEKATDDSDDAEEKAESKEGEKVVDEPKAEEVKPVEQAEQQAVEQPAQQVEQQPGLVEAYTAITAEIDSLGVKMENGDIGFAEYNRKLNELISHKTRIEILYENQQREIATAANAWDSAQEKFFSDPVHAAIKEKPLLYNAMSAAVSEVSQSQEAKGKSYDWILNQAKARVEDELGISFGSKQAAKEPIKQPGKKALNETDLPRTLGNIPASQSHDAGEFAHLDRMSSTERESALAKMKPDEIDRYLAAA